MPVCRSGLLEINCMLAGLVELPDADISDYHLPICNSIQLAGCHADLHVPVCSPSILRMLASQSLSHSGQSSLSWGGQALAKEHRSAMATSDWPKELATIDIDCSHICNGCRTPAYLHAAEAALAFASFSCDLMDQSTQNTFLDSVTILPQHAAHHLSC